MVQRLCAMLKADTFWIPPSVDHTRSTNDGEINKTQGQGGRKRWIEREREREKKKKKKKNNKKKPDSCSLGSVLVAENLKPWCSDLKLPSCEAI